MQVLVLCCEGMKLKGLCSRAATRNEMEELSIEMYLGMEL